MTTPDDSGVSLRHQEDDNHQLAGAASSRYVGQGLDQTGPTPPTPAVPQKPVAWQAAEYVQHAKGPRWLLGYGALVVVVFGVAYLTGSVTFMVLVLVMALAVGVFAFRPPRIVNYSVTGQGIQIDDKTYNYHDFRAFGVTTSENAYSAVLVPTKRFGLAVRLYFSEEQGAQIVDALGAHLPMEDMREDPIDKLLSRLHF